MFAGYFGCFCPNPKLEPETRTLLMNHLTRGTGLCFLNTLLRVPALPSEDLAEARRADQALNLAREHTGLASHPSEQPVRRLLGPLWNLVDLDGHFVHVSDRRHPFGPGRRKFMDLDTDIVPAEGD